MVGLALLTLGWCTFWAILAIRNMIRGDQAIIFPVLLVTYVFFALPLAYDVIVGPTEMARFPGMQAALASADAYEVYLGYVALIFPIMYACARFAAKPTRVTSKERTEFSLPGIVKAACVALLIAPIALVGFAPNPGIYQTYAVSLQDTFTGEIAEYHSFIAVFVRIGVVAAVALLLSAKRITLPLVSFILVLLAAGAWLQGKRSAIAIILLGIGFAFWQRGYLRGRRLVVFGLLAAIGLGIFSVTYQRSVRSHDIIATSYDGFRIDYGRDSQTRMAIFAERNPDQMTILEHPGQTLPLYVAQLVPRSIWPSKPMPYSQYFTSASLLQPPKEWGWGFTTSWFEEWISNIGGAAYFVAPALLGLLCRWANRANLAILRAVLTVILVLLVVQEVAAFAFLLPIAAALVVWEILATKRDHVTSNSASFRRQMSALR